MKVNKRQLQSLIIREVRRITEQIDTSVPHHQRHKADAILMERIPGSITIIDPTTIFDLDSSGDPTREEGTDSKGMRMKGGHYESLRTPEPLVVGENLAFLVKRMEISSFGMSLDLGGDRYRMGVDPNASRPEGHWLVGEVLWIEGPPTSPGKVLLGSAREVPQGPFNEGRRLTEQEDSRIAARNESISRSLQAGQVTLISHDRRMSDMRSLMEGFMLNEADVTYTVSRGDVLSKITKRFYGKTDRATYTALADVNDISDPNKIEVGQEIRIPGTLTVDGVDVEASGGTPDSSQSRAAGEVRGATTSRQASEETETSSDESEEEALDDWERSEDWNKDQMKRLARSNIRDWGRHDEGWSGVGKGLALEVERGDSDSPEDINLLNTHMREVIQALKRTERDSGYSAMMTAYRRFSSGFLDTSTDGMTGLEMSTLIARRLAQLNSGLTIRDTRYIFNMLEDAELAVEYDYED